MKTTAASPGFSVLHNFRLGCALALLTLPFAGQLAAQVVPGVYNGLVYETGGVAHASAGFVNFTVKSNLSNFTAAGKLNLDGNSLPFAGTLDQSGNLSQTVARSQVAKSNLLLTLSVDGDAATGTVSEGSNWTSVLMADRWTWTANSPASAYSNAYTMVIPAFTSNNDGPVGPGWATITVDKLGKIKMTGAMGDGQKLVQATMLSPNGEWPLFVPLYPNKKSIIVNGSPKTISETYGELIGWVRLLPNTNFGTANLAPSGFLDWIKTGGTNPPNFLSGFTNQSDVLGSRHLRPSQANPLLYPYDGLLAALSEGNLTNPFGASLTIKTNNKFQMTLPLVNGFKAALASKSGFITGTFTNTATGAKLKWKGVMLQDSTNLLVGHGSFMEGTNGSGKVEFTRLSQITGVEGSFLSPGGGTIFVRGNNFSPGDTVFIGGVQASSVTFIDSTLLQATFGALGAGTFDVVVVNPDTGSTNSTLKNAVTVEGSPLASLETPPGTPLGAPIASLLESKPDLFIWIGDNIYGDSIDTGIRSVRGLESETEVVPYREGGLNDTTHRAARPTGNFNATAVDLAISSGIGPDFILGRAYRSRLGATNSPFGSGWDFSYNISVETNGSDVIIHDGGGRADRFYRQANGTYTRDEFFREGKVSANKFTLTFAGKGQWQFNAFNAPVAPGKIAKSVDRNGNAMTFKYNAGGQLAQVIDALNRTNKFFYNGSGLLTNVTDFSGRAVRYEYDGNGDLARAISPVVTGTPNGNDFPGGKTNSYTYTSGLADARLNHNLTGVIDNTGEQVVTIAYTTNESDLDFEFDRVTSIALGTNTPTMFTYLAQTPSPGNQFATTKVIANDPVGNVTEILYDSKNRPVNVREFTGRSTPGQPVGEFNNRPMNKLRVTDPDFFETTMEWNLDSQPTKVVSPRGGSMLAVYERDLNKSAAVRERGNMREVTQTPAPGVPSDQELIVQKFEYQPGFGMSEALDSKERGRIEFPQLAVTIIERDFDTWLNGIVKYTDTRSNVWNYAYDGKGNLTNALPPGVATGDAFEYNAKGQMTAHTHPADANGYRRRDTFNYYASGPQKDYLQTAVEDAGGGGLALTTTYEYDARGNVTKVIDPRGNDTQFVFNQLNQLMQVKSPPDGAGVRQQTDYTYPENGAFDLDYTFGTVNENTITRWVTEEESFTDANGNPIDDGKITTGYGYDLVGRLTSVTNEVSDVASTVTHFEYDAAGQLVLARSPEAVNGNQPDNVASFSYDERGLPFQQSSAPGSADQSTTQYDYDADGNLSRVSAGLEGVAPLVTTIEIDGFAVADRAKTVLVSRYLSIAEQNVHRSAGGGGNNLGLGSLATEDSGGDGGGPLGVQSGGSTGHGSYSPEIIGSGIQVLPPLEHRYGSSSPEIIGTSILHRGSPDYVRNPAVLFYPSSKLGGGGSTGFDFDNAQAARCLRRATQIRNTAMSSVANADAGYSALQLYQAYEWVRPCPSHVDYSTRPSKITDPMGNVTEFHYDASGNLTNAVRKGEANDVPGSAGNVKLAEIAFEYTARGDLKRTCEWNAYDGTCQEISDGRYSDSGQIIAITNALGNVTSFAYDTAGRLASVTDAKTNSITYAYDANGNVLTTTQTNKSDLGNADLVFVKTFGYDNLNRRTNATDNVGNTTFCAYDSRGNLVRHTDANVRLSRYEYDGLNRLTRSGHDMNDDGDAFGSSDIVSSRSYDDNSRPLAGTDANTNTTSYVYDSLNRLIQTTLADGTSNSVAYDVHGNVTSATDANGTVVACTYDTLNRLTQKDITPGNGVDTNNWRVSFNYDGESRWTRCTNFEAPVNATCEATYDSLGRRLTETQNGLTVSNTYDAAGNRLTVTYPGGRTLGYTYDAANLCRTVSLLATSDGDTLGLICSNSYVGGALERRDNRNDTFTTWSYDGGVGTANANGDFGWGQVSGVQHVHTNGTVIDDRSFAWDAAQNKIAREDLRAGGPQLKHAYSYDAANRLTQTLVTDTLATLIRDTDYTLDLAGNRLNVTGDNHPGSYTLDATTPEPADFQMNQYSTTPVGDFTYDKNGNRIFEDDGTVSKNYSYDYANRLVSLSNLLTGASANYAYDALGRRIQKTVVTGGMTNTTQFVYDGSAVIEERDGTGAVNATFTGVPQWGMVAFETFEGSPSGSGWSSMRRNGTNYWSHTVDMGSTMALTLDDGTVAERYEYQDFGEPEFYDANGTPLSGSAVGNPYLWGGMRYDEESGFYLKTFCGGVCDNPDSDANGPWCFTTATCNGYNWDSRVAKPLQRGGDGPSKERIIRVLISIGSSSFNNIGVGQSR